MGTLDGIISFDIEERDKETIATYWKSIFASITDILSRIFEFSSDFTDLIKEAPLEKRNSIYNHTEYLKDSESFQKFLTENPEQNRDTIDERLEIFNQI